MNAGADKASINTAAVKTPELVKAASDRFGSQAIVVAIDARKKKRKARAGKCSRTVAATLRAWTLSNGRKNDRTRCGRNPAHQHGSRWHQIRIRSRP